MPAEPTLTEQAYRVSEDVPDDNIIRIETIAHNLLWVERDVIRIHLKKTYRTHWLNCVGLKVIEI